MSRIHAIVEREPQIRELPDDVSLRVLTALLRRFAFLPNAVTDHLGAFASRQLRNTAGTLVGRIEALPLPSAVQNPIRSWVL